MKAVGDGQVIERRKFYLKKKKVNAIRSWFRIFLVEFVTAKLLVLICL